MDTSLILLLLGALAVVQLVLVIWLLARRQPKPDHSEMLGVLAAMGSANERTERELRHEIGEGSRGARQETAQAFATFQQSLTQQGAEATRTQNAQLDAFAQQLTLLQKTLADTLNTQLQGLSDSNARRLSEVRMTMETQLAQLQQSNTAKLDEMRKTVDEKLQTTLEARLGESFKQVADRLEQVHKGLGEMQTLAVGVGSLQRVLTNVKTRGVFGEVQLEALLEQVLTTDQYAKQVETKPRSGQRVDFAILVLPVESLYAEVLRRPGLMDAIQRQHRVTLAGPTTLLAMLNSLHMGFRTLALEQQASEVWKVLGAVKTEFERYGEWVARIKEQVAKASDTLDKADTRAKQMRLALRKVEALPEAQSQVLLPPTADSEGDDTP